MVGKIFMSTKIKKDKELFYFYGNQVCSPRKRRKLGRVRATWGASEYGSVLFFKYWQLNKSSCYNYSLCYTSVLCTFPYVIFNNKNQSKSRLKLGFYLEGGESNVDRSPGSVSSYM
jgi:hypothetical protein